MYVTRNCYVILFVDPIDCIGRFVVRHITENAQKLNSYFEESVEASMALCKSFQIIRLNFELN